MHTPPPNDALVNAFVVADALRTIAVSAPIRHLKIHLDRAGCAEPTDAARRVWSTILDVGVAAPTRRR